MTQAKNKLKPTIREKNSNPCFFAGGRRTAVRESGIHGKGVYAIRPIKAGEMVLEYKGRIITWRKAQALHPHDPGQPNHTFYFHLDDGHVIDARQNGNSARWINHACDPNLEARQEGSRVFLDALRDIEIGEELFYDYSLMIEGRKTARIKQEYACLCGAHTCRGTMLHITKRIKARGLKEKGIKKLQSSS